MQKTSSSIVYLGVDIGKSEHAWTLVDHRGSLLEEGVIGNTSKCLTGKSGSGRTTDFFKSQK